MYCMLKMEAGAIAERHILTEECYQIVKEALDETRIMREIIERFEFFHDSLLELETWCRSVNQSNEYLMRNLHKAERLCRAVLFEFRTYINHLETTFKRVYGEDSEIVSIFKIGTNNAYDNCPEYAFVYQLRNNMQHFEKIVHSFVAPKKKAYLQPCSTPTRLLEDEKWKEQELTFIKSQKGNIDLQEAFEKTYNAMGEILVPVMNYFFRVEDGATKIQMLRNWIDTIFTREESKYYHLAIIDESNGNIDALPIYWETIYKIYESMNKVEN